MAHKKIFGWKRCPGEDEDTIFKVLSDFVSQYGEDAKSVGKTRGMQRGKLLLTQLFHREWSNNEEVAGSKRPKWDYPFFLRNMHACSGRDDRRCKVEWAKLKAMIGLPTKVVLERRPFA